MSADEPHLWCTGHTCEMHADERECPMWIDVQQAMEASDV